MYPDLQKELDTFVRLTPKSAEAHKKNLKRIPLGGASNYRAYDPYPIFVKEGQGSHSRDLERNDFHENTSASGGFGAPKASSTHVTVATFKDLEPIEGCFKANSKKIAAILLEPNLMNINVCLPQTRFLEGLNEIATRNGPLLIFDEV